MHNLISYNNLKAWMPLTMEENMEEVDQVTEYFECITDCAIDDKSCISECRLVLDQKTEQNGEGFYTPLFNANLYNQQCTPKGYAIHNSLLKELQS